VHGSDLNQEDKIPENPEISLDFPRSFKANPGQYLDMVTTKNKKNSMV
jgi:hypothetical protein